MNSAIMPIMPRSGWYIVAKYKAETMATHGKLIMPNMPEQDIYEIVQTGWMNTACDFDWQLQIGDRVIIKSYTGQKVLHNGKDYYLINKDDILGLYERETDNKRNSICRVPNVPNCS